MTASAPPLCGEIVGQFSPIRYRSISVSMIDEPLIGIGPGTGRTAGLGWAACIGAERVQLIASSVELRSLVTIQNDYMGELIIALL